MTFEVFLTTIAALAFATVVIFILTHQSERRAPTRRADKSRNRSRDDRMGNN